MKRHATKIVLFLLLGAIINVAVAWGCASLADFRSASEQIVVTKAPTFAWWISDARRSTFGVTQSVRRALLPTSYGVAGDMYILEFDEDAQPILVLKPGQTIERDATQQMRTIPPGPGLSSFIAIEPWENSAGWPARSMCCWMENLTGYPSSTAFAARGTVTLNSGLNPYGNRPGPDANVLPLHPIWPGFAINTIFYAAILWLPVAGLGARRRRRRIKRGLCARCGYPLSASGSAVCSECGTPINRK